jgi:FkbM family methyltransferase
MAVAKAAPSGAPNESLMRTIKGHLPGYNPTIVFDVGANTGQSVAAFSEMFPGAIVYAFEPVEMTYRALEASARSRANVRAFKLALGRMAGDAPMIVDPTRLTDSQVTVRPPRPGQRMETVRMETGDAFCTANGVDRIGYLKIDTEGHDLDVLAGFSRMLAEKRIDLAEAEVGMNRWNNRHVPLEKVKELMEAAGYALFHVYEQAMDTAFSGRPLLRRANVVFISPAMVEQYRRGR